MGEAWWWGYNTKVAKSFVQGRKVAPLAWTIRLLLFLVDLIFYPPVQIFCFLCVQVAVICFYTLRHLFSRHSLEISKCEPKLDSFALKIAIYTYPRKSRAYIWIFADKRFCAQSCGSTTLLLLYLLPSPFKLNTTQHPTTQIHSVNWNI